MIAWLRSLLSRLRPAGETEEPVEYSAAGLAASLGVWWQCRRCALIVTADSEMTECPRCGGKELSR